MIQIIQKTLLVFLCCALAFQLDSANNDGGGNDASYDLQLANKQLLSPFDINTKAFHLISKGWHYLSSKNQLSQKPVVTLIDFTRPSVEKRLWVIDLEKLEILHHDYCAHGKNTGTQFAKDFSNVSGSYQSSLGFYKTAEIYQGKHGTSLRLDGLDKGINCKARDRAIVMHGADYVSEDFIAKHGRLGRSFGCPSVTYDQHENIINEIAGNTLLFIYAGDEDYLNESTVLEAINDDNI